MRPISTPNGAAVLCEAPDPVTLPMLMHPPLRLDLRGLGLSLQGVLTVREPGGLTHLVVPAPEDPARIAAANPQGLSVTLPAPQTFAGLRAHASLVWLLWEGEVTLTLRVTGAHVPDGHPAGEALRREVEYAGLL